MPSPDPSTSAAAHRCSSCGRARAECRTSDDPFLSCCSTCAASDGDTHRETPEAAIREAERRALHHPEIERMRRDPRWLTDVEYRYAGETLQKFLLALYRAFAEEDVDVDLRERLVNRAIYGNPRGIPLDSLQVLDPRTRYRMRSDGDGLGPLMPGDAVRETVRVNLDGVTDPALREKIAGALSGLSEEKQARWLVEGGEDRHHVGGPPPNAAAEPAAAAEHRQRLAVEPDYPPEIEPPPRWQRALRRLRGGGEDDASEPESP